ncbi:hypothetical protein LP422_00715 [Janibacter limosus]|uniref:Uncharacterized protein n=1 Tax=Janibacter limosus TaxID=53458 RepID=A0AC61U4H5_9MICO|nr:hypothetical protein [Janibacter limosus]UUZ44950.1 hypothetical protein LP422_00715 [Janibacter limosus]
MEEHEVGFARPRQTGMCCRERATSDRAGRRCRAGQLGRLGDLVRVEVAEEPTPRARYRDTGLP